MQYIAKNGFAIPPKREFFRKLNNWPRHKKTAIAPFTERPAIALSDCDHHGTPLGKLACKPLARLVFLK
jgi:hypothetical protein